MTRQKLPASTRPLPRRSSKRRWNGGGLKPTNVQRLRSRSGWTSKKRSVRLERLNNEPGKKKRLAGSRKKRLADGAKQRTKCDAT